MMHCEKCKSPVNMTKAARRYAKKVGTDKYVNTGFCACGKLINASDYLIGFYTGTLEYEAEHERRMNDTYSIRNL